MHIASYRIHIIDDRTYFSWVISVSPSPFYVAIDITWSVSSYIHIYNIETHNDRWCHIKLDGAASLSVCNGDIIYRSNSSNISKKTSGLKIFKYHLN